MARTFELTWSRRLANWMMTRLLRLGVPVGNNYLLTVTGRKTGKQYTTPIMLTERDDQRYLVAPYGEVSWVKNARSAGRVTLSRGRHREHVSITELPPAEAAPILKQYVNEVPIVRPFFNAEPEAPETEFEAEAGRKPVFRLG